MGLNDPGLQSLSSIDASEFFDVTITDTNSPIEQGDTLVVDYEVSNTGDKTGSQDITLEIDSVLEDTDAGVRVLANRTDSGTLEWVTDSGETAQDYTATVLSADGSATQTVTVEGSETAIPDSVVNHLDFWWPISASDTDTQLTDSLEDETATMSGGSLVTDDRFVDDTAADLTGTDSHWTSDSRLGSVDQITMVGWVDDVTSSDFGEGIMMFTNNSDPNTRGEPTVGIRTSSGGDDINALSVDGGGSPSGTTFGTTNLPDVSDVFVSVSVDFSGTSTDFHLRIYDNDSQIEDSTTSIQGVGGFDGFFEVGVENGSSLNMTTDAIGINTGSILTETQVEEIWQDTLRDDSGN